MTYILHIETATKNCSVALAKDGQLLQCKEIAEEGFSHAEKLHIFIEEILKENQVGFNHLSAIAVSQGPGSYTGLRIGVSAAKGLCYALQIPMIALDTLESLARQLKIDSGIVIPMLDARRMECFTAIFDANYVKIREIQAEIIDSSTYKEIDEIIHLIGDGALKCKEVLLDDKFIYYNNTIFPSAKEMVTTAFEKYKKSDTVDVAYFEPFYLKDFMMNISKKSSLITLFPR